MGNPQDRPGLGQGVFLERTAHHFQQAGWTVKVRPELDMGGRPFRPDLLLEKPTRSCAVMVRGEEPPGPFHLADFGAACRKLKLGAILVCPDDASTRERCEDSGIDFVPGESIGDIIVMGHAPEPVPIQVSMPAARPAPPVELPQVPQPVYVAAAQPIPMWRWAIVGLIWTAAVALLTYDFYRWTH